VADQEAGVAVFTSPYEAELEALAALLEDAGIQTSVYHPPRYGYGPIHGQGTVYVRPSDVEQARALIESEWGTQATDDAGATAPRRRRSITQQAFVWLLLVTMVGAGVIAVIVRLLRWISGF
jgi:hypothetical protein